MKRQFSISILLMAAISPAWGQLMSSHSTSASAPASADQPSGRAVARVNGAVLTDRDLLREEYAIFPYARQHNGVPKGMEADIRAGAMKMMEFEELVYQDAMRRKITIPTSTMQKAQSDFRKQFATPQEYQDLLNSEFKGSKSLLNTKIERSLLIDKILKAEVEDRSNISISGARAYYDKNPDKFRYPESYSVQTISVIPPENANPEQIKQARKKAEEAVKQAKQTKNYDDFGVLAEKISEDDYRVMMGDHHAVDKGKLPPAVLQAVTQMQVGDVSGLIDIGNNAYTVVRLNAHTAAGIQKFEDVKDSLREYLKKQRTEELRRALDARLRKNAKVEEL